jgi:6-phosphogluconolactonase
MMAALSHEAVWHSFSSSEALAEALADDVADRLRHALKTRDRATLAVSGGTTPGRFFDALSQRHLDWANVVVTLVDERFVPGSSDRSNERLVRERLMRNEARLARFLPLYADMASAEAAARQAEAGLVLLGFPLDAAILGMGTDGHTASFFPDAPNLDRLTDPGQSRLVMPVEAASAGETRLTLTLPAVVGARFLALHIEGQEKRDVLEAALEPGGTKPISAIFAHANRPLPVYWAG